MRALAVSLLAVTACTTPQPPVAALAPSASARLEADAPAPTTRPEPKLVRVTTAGGSVVLVRVDEALLAYVADEDGKRLVVMDVDSGEARATVALEGSPTSLVLMSDQRVAVALRELAKVQVLRGMGTKESPLTHVGSFATATEPVGLAVTPDDSTVLATSGWGHAITAASSKDYSVTWQRSLGREPRGVAVSSDGKRAFVAHAVGKGLSIVDLVDATAKPKVWFLDAENGVPGFRGMTTWFGRRSAQGYAVAISDEPEGRVFLPHVEVHFGGPHPQTDFGVGTVENTGYGDPSAGDTTMFDVAVVDAVKGSPMDFNPVFTGGTSAQLVRTVDTDRECMLPRAAAASGTHVYVACLDTDTVLDLDARIVSSQAVPLRKWSVTTPSALAADAQSHRLVVWSQMNHALTTLALAGNATLALAALDVPPVNKPDPLVERGRRIFHRQVGADGRTCASCHPEGRDDGFVWDTPNGPRQTPMLAGRVTTSAPYGWTGEAKTLEEHLPKTLARVEGKLDDDEKTALLAYVRSLAPPPRPAPAVDATVARGRELFESSDVGCSQCHMSGGDVPDGMQHNVRSSVEGDVAHNFDTPSLRYLEGTAPYFHNGRYDTLEALLAGTDGTMGHTSQLSKSDRAALLAYLRTR